MKVSRTSWKTIPVLGLVFILSSCEKSLEQKDYAAYVTNPENGLKKTQVIGDFEISALYEPVDFILSKEFSLEDKQGIEQRRTELASFEHFQFRIKLLEGGNILNHDETMSCNESSRVNHFSFEATGDFMLIAGGDTLPCKLAHYSRNYNLTPTIDLTLSFPKANETNDLKLIYTDSQFSIGKVKFLFERERIEDTPALKI